MNHSLLSGAILPSELAIVPSLPISGHAIYSLVIEDIQLVIRQSNESIYAIFTRIGLEDQASIYDITAEYREDEYSTLQKLVMATYCQFLKLHVDSDLDLSVYSEVSLEIERFTREIEKAIPKAFQSEDLLIGEGEEGQASGVYFFILKEQSLSTDNENESYCFIELGVNIPGYCDDNCDASISLWVMPKLNESTKDEMVTSRRKSFVGHYIYDVMRLFKHYPTETILILGEVFSKAPMQSIVEELAFHINDWLYQSTKESLANLCPELQSLEIQTDSASDDTGGCFNYITTITFKSQSHIYIYSYESIGFMSDEDLLDDNGEFGGESYALLQGILGRDFATNEVFRLVETFTHLMMRRDCYFESIVCAAVGVTQ
jgi:hypothetical protein